MDGWWKRLLADITRRLLCLYNKVGSVIYPSRPVVWRCKNFCESLCICLIVPCHAFRYAHYSYRLAAAFSFFFFTALDPSPVPSFFFTFFFFTRSTTRGSSTSSSASIGFGTPLNLAT